MSADFIDGNKALLLRRAILLQLEAASPASLPPDALSAGLKYTLCLPILKPWRR
ncbi:MAG: hypothetical protein ACLUKN_07960 [Bacilli bacterium]